MGWNQPKHFLLTWNWQCLKRKKKEKEKDKKKKKKKKGKKEKKKEEEEGKMCKINRKKISGNGIRQIVRI